MIYGIGVDVVDISRIYNIEEKHGDAFAKRVLSSSEFKQHKLHQQPSTFLAKRFAAKEAFLKALGIGLFRGVSMNQLSIENDDLGKPMVKCDSDAQNYLEKLSISKSHLSISDEKKYAVAMVVLEI